MASLEVVQAVRVVEFFLDDTTPSKNSPLVRTSWKSKAEQKAHWQERIITELERLEMPRPIPKRGPLIVYCTERFKARRDQELQNYQPFAAEVILDALIGGHPNYSRGETRRHDGWLHDDTDDQVEFNFDILRDRGRVGTGVRLVWRTP